MVALFAAVIVEVCLTETLGSRLDLSSESHDLDCKTKVPIRN